MAQIDTPRGLLAMALRDLLDAETALMERLPFVLSHANDGAFQAFIAADQKRSIKQRDRLEALVRSLGAELKTEPCVWMRAVLDDADNDAATIAAGRWRDVALVGALRKGKQSERVSYETALALAEHLGLNDAAATLRTIRDEEAAADKTLAALLRALSTGGT